MINIVILIALGLLTIEDIKRRKVNLKICIVAEIMILIVDLLMNKEIWIISGGLVWGISFFLISKVSKEALGYGDDIVIFIIGSALGFVATFQILLFSFLIAGALCILIMAVKRMRLRIELPFVPFLLLGTTINLLI